jgi:serine/threonine protein kinase
MPNYASEIENSSFPQIENLEFLELVGSGGMSVVYKARQTNLDRVVAVKLLSGMALSEEESARRFQKEARLTSLLDHTNIVKTLGFGIAGDGRPYLVMEYLEGITLAQELKTNGRLSLQKFRQVFIPVLSALAHAHESGLVHRDIKPANIMLVRLDNNPDGVKLLDFGIARLFAGDVAESQRLTAQGTLLGSPRYMSPEQCLGGEVDWRSDIYSISCVMYEALCGTPPFTGGSVLEVLDMHVSAALPTVAELCKQIELDPELAALILSGLSKDPVRRPQSAAGLACRLNEILEDLTLNRVPRLKLASDRQSRRLIAAAVIALIALAGGLALSGFACFKLRAGSVAPAKDESFMRANPDNLLRSGKELEDRHSCEDALAKYEAAIKVLHTRPHRQESLTEAYMGAAGCARFLSRPLGTLPGPEHSSTATDQARWYSDRAMALSVQSRSKKLIVEACKQRAYSIHEPSVQKLYELIKTIDRSCGKGSWESLDVREGCIGNMLGLMDNQELELLIVDTIELSSRYGKEHYRYLAARASLAVLRAYQGRFRESNQLCEEIGFATIASRHPSLSPGRRIGDICVMQIFRALELTKNTALAQKLVEKELACNGAQDNSIPWQIGALYRRLGDIKRACGDHDGAIEQYEKALPYFTKKDFNKHAACDCLKALVEVCGKKNLADRVRRYELQLSDITKAR